VEAVRYPATAVVAVDQAIIVARRAHDSYTDPDPDHARPAAVVLFADDEVVTRDVVQHAASPRTVLRDDVQ
jgi:hypothetical protein